MDRAVPVQPANVPVQPANSPPPANVPVPPANVPADDDHDDQPTALSSASSSTERLALDQLAVSERASLSVPLPGVDRFASSSASDLLAGSRADAQRDDLQGSQDQLVDSFVNMQLPPAEQLFAGSRAGLSEAELEEAYKALVDFVDGRLPEQGMDFDVWKFTEAQLYGVCLGMWHVTLTPHYLGVPLAELLDIVVEVERNYKRDIPYHNFRHAVDVTHTLFYMLRDLGAVRFFVQIDLVAVLFAALCHDISHPGLNNIYQVNGKTELAQRYNNISVLENHSVAQALDLLSKSQLLRNIEETGEADYVRETIRACILSTDMVHHFTLLKDFARAVDELLHESKEQHQLAAANATASISTVQQQQDESVTSVASTQGATATPASATPASTPAASVATAISSNTTNKSIPTIVTTGISAEASSPISPTIPVSPGASMRALPRLSTHGRPASASASIYSHESAALPQSILSDGEQDEITIQLPLSPPRRLIFLKALLHASDIANPCRPWDISLLWSNRVKEEFWYQGDMEKAHGLAVSPNMDRNTTNPVDMTLGFMDFMVKPYYEGLANFIKELRVFTRILHANREQWASRQKPAGLAVETNRPDASGLSQMTTGSATKSVVATPLPAPNRDDNSDEVDPERINNILSPLRRISVFGRRMSFAAGVITIPDSAATEEIAKTAVFSRINNVSFEFTPSSASGEDVRSSASSLGPSQSEQHELASSRSANVLASPLRQSTTTTDSNEQFQRHFQSRRMSAAIIQPPSTTSSSSSSSPDKSKKTSTRRRHVSSERHAVPSAKRQARLAGVIREEEPVALSGGGGESSKGDEQHRGRTGGDAKK